MRFAHLLGIGLFATAGAIAVTHAVTDAKREKARAMARARAFAAVLELAPAPAPTSLHVTLNGIATRVGFATAPKALDVATRDARACDPRASDERSVTDGEGDALERETVHVDEAEGGAANAVLCVFRVRGTTERRERMTFLRRIDGSTTSAVTIARDSAFDLVATFPAEGDAPGRDPETVPRPARARRVLSAAVIENGHEVWMYETSDAITLAGDDLERRMTDAGWKRTLLVDGSNDARLYRRDGDDAVIVLEHGAAGTRITISRSRRERQG